MESQQSQTGKPVAPASIFLWLTSALDPLINSTILIIVLLPGLSRVRWFPVADVTQINFENFEMLNQSRSFRFFFLAIAKIISAMSHQLFDLKRLASTASEPSEAGRCVEECAGIADVLGIGLHWHDIKRMLGPFLFLTFTGFLKSDQNF